MSRGTRVALATQCALLTACASSGTQPVIASLTSIPGGVEGSVNLEYYDVHGTSRRELLSQMRQLGPYAAGPGGAVARTSWGIHWQYQPLNVAGGGGCALSNVKVTLDITITLPRWDAPKDAPAELVEWWNNYLVEVEKHGATHKQIATGAAREIASSLTRFKASCSTISGDASAMANQIMQRSRMAQERFDADELQRREQGRDSRPPASKPL